MNVHPLIMMTTMSNTQKADRLEATLVPSVELRQSLKKQLDALTTQLAEVDSQIIEAMRDAGLKSIETSLGKVNLIQPATTVWNESILSDVLTTAQWNRVTVRKLDKSLLEAELTIGRIDSSLVDAAKSTKESKPYLR